jgi:hypothetical protein
MPTTELTVPNACPEPSLTTTLDFAIPRSARSGSWQDIIKVLEENAMAAADLSRQLMNRMVTDAKDDSSLAAATQLSTTKG